MISTKTVTCVTLCLMVVSECWFPADSYAVYHFKRYSYKKKQKNVSTYIISNSTHKKCDNLFPLPRNKLKFNFEMGHFLSSFRLTTVTKNSTT